MKFLIDSAPKQEIITEALTGGAKRMYVQGPFLMHSVPNQNGRIYPESVMDSAVSKYKKTYINESRSIGELNHPSQLKANPERACIITQSLEKDGKNHYFGKAKVLSTPLGKLLEALLDDGVKVGVSSRGVGSISSQGKHKIVGPDYEMTVAADVVFDPSVGNAFVEHLMEEKEYILIGEDYVEKDLVEAKNLILAAPMSKLQEAKLAAFTNFLNKLSYK